MYLELLKERIKYWNHIPLLKDKKDLVIEMRLGSFFREPSTDYYICLFTKQSGLFLKSSYSLKDDNKELGFELTAERAVKDLMSYGISNCIQITKDLGLKYV